MNGGDGKSNVHLKPPISILSVSDPDDKNNQSIIVN